ncbi:hypothetical protein [Massilia eburnea]|uniref:hypothetical protein n=1 Tax=Massilia eburnea TaxID=1776165 RepID=UPI003D6BCA7E
MDRLFAQMFRQGLQHGPFGRGAGWGNEGAVVLRGAAPGWIGIGGCGSDCGGQQDEQAHVSSNSFMRCGINSILSSALKLVAAIGDFLLWPKLFRKVQLLAVAPQAGLEFLALPEFRSPAGVGAAAGPIGQDFARARPIQIVFVMLPGCLHCRKQDQHRNQK